MPTLNSMASAARRAAISSGGLPASSLLMRKNSSAVENAGTVVHSICRIWANRSTPAQAAAKFVVSDKGESLSPK